MRYIFSIIIAWLSGVFSIVEAAVPSASAVVALASDVVGLPSAVVGLPSDVTYTKADSITICRLLNEAPPNAGTLWFAQHFIGVPYVAHTLEVNDTEKLVVNTRQLDCTTFVETVTALKMCVDRRLCRWTDFLAMLTKLRYRGGVIAGYASRLHYFSDWIIDNGESLHLVTDIQMPRPPFSAIQTLSINFMSTHVQSYKALKADGRLVPLIRLQEKKLTGRKWRYIPKAQTANAKLLSTCVRDGDIIAITTKKKGLDIAHLGFAAWHDGQLHLLNASSIHKCVVDEPMTLHDYLSKHPSFTGVKIIRINPPQKK